MQGLLKELFRKSIHICAALVPVGLYFFYEVTMILLLAVLILYIISEILRKKGIRFPVIAFITELAARDRDRDKFVMGPVTLVLGILITAWLLPFKYAKVGVWALAFGDGLASIGGKAIGGVKIPFTKGKTLAGSLTCLVAVFIMGLCCTGDFQISITLAVATMIIEMLPLGDWDNVLIPVCIGGLSVLIIP